jgi:hypothetical protein
MRHQKMFEMINQLAVYFTLYKINIKWQHTRQTKGAQVETPDQLKAQARVTHGQWLLAQLGRNFSSARTPNIKFLKIYLEIETTELQQISLGKPWGRTLLWSAHLQVLHYVYI